ncbi:MAG: hypothetical protein IKT88_03285, partial [Lachnospiraceae bacterium]|nr:hypothetical protein [Lachnospiraceae bacterium]
VYEPTEAEADQDTVITEETVDTEMEQDSKGFPVIPVIAGVVVIVIIAVIVAMKKKTYLDD